MVRINQMFSLSSTILIIFAGPLDPPLDQPKEPPPPLGPSPLLGQPEAEPPLCQPFESTYPADAQYTITPRTTNTCESHEQNFKKFSYHS